VKIIYLIDTLEVGGAELSLLALTQRLRRIEPVVCHLYKGDTIRARFESAGVRVVSLNLAGPYNLMRAYWQFRNLCIKEKPDAIVSTLYRSDLVARTVGYPLRIMQIGSWVSDSYSESKKSTLAHFSRWKYALFFWLNLLTIRLSTAIISNSEAIKISNCKALRVPPDKVKVIYRGRVIQPELQKPPRYSPGDVVRFLSVGRLIRGKGLEELIRSFSELVMHQPEARLTIAGDGPLLGELKRIVTDRNLENNVEFRGYVEDVGRLYASHHCLVFPSHLEGLSGVLIESMLHHLPVLASDIPMNREIIDHGITGYLFSVGNEQALLQALQWFMENANSSYSLAGAAYLQAIERFDIEKVVRQHEDFVIESQETYQRS